MRSHAALLVTVCSLLLVSLAGCSTETIVRYPPPPEREEVVGVAPSPEHFWIRGAWRWEGDKYAWAGGRWEVKRTDAVWAPGHWRSNASGAWVYTEGRWTAR